MSILCRRCLISEAGQEELYSSIMDYIDAIPANNKATADEYTRRLNVCKACDLLTNGMCAICGCFVELRAAKANKRCAKDYW